MVTRICRQIVTSHLINTCTFYDLQERLELSAELSVAVGKIK